MCVANLNVSVQPCSHRWYRLVRSCSDSSNLANCPRKLKLEGWETKNDVCPWCSPPTSPAAAEIDDSTHKLFGGMSPTDSRRRSASTAGSSQSPTRGRNNSISTSSIPTSRSSSQDSDTEAERNRMMNKRLQAYITMNPGKIFSSAPVDELPSVNETPSDSPTVSRNNSVVGKGWKRGVKISKGMFKS